MKQTIINIGQLIILGILCFGCSEKDEPYIPDMDGGYMPGAVALEGADKLWHKVKDTTLIFPSGSNEYIMEVKSQGFESGEIRNIETSGSMKVTLLDSVLADMKPCERIITQYGIYINQRDTTYYYKQRLLIKSLSRPQIKQKLKFTIYVWKYNGLYSNFTIETRP